MISLSPMQPNETKYDRILGHEVDFANCESCPFRRLNDTFQKTLLKAAKKKTTTHHKSQVQSDMRASFKLTYRENNGKL